MRLVIFMLSIALLPLVLGQTISGSDDILNFARPTDAVTINVPVVSVASAPSSVLSSRVRVRGPNGDSSAQICVPLSATTYECTYRERIENVQGELLYLVEVKDADGNTQSAHELVLYIDELGPSIIDADVLPRVSSTNEFTLILRAQDYSHEQGNSNDCAGIALVTVTASGKEIYRTEPDQCNIDIRPTFSLPQVGSHQVCVTVTDHFQATTQECFSVSYDTTGPEPAFVGYGRTDGLLLQQVPEGGQELLPTIRLADPAGVSHMEARFDAYHAQFLQPTQVDNDTYFFDAVKVEPNTPCTVFIRATDKLGNTAEHNESCSANVDNTPPKHIRFDSAYADIEGNVIIGEQATLRAVIEEPGSGLWAADVQLDLRQLGGSTVAADTCQKEDRWTCTWHNVTTRHDGTFLIPITATDLAGNRMIDEDIVQVIRDVPVIKKIEQTPSYVSAKSQLQYVLTVNSLVDVDISATLSQSLDPSQDEISGECQIQTAQGEWICVVSIPRIPNDYVEGDIVLSITDKLGTIIRERRALTVYAVGDEGEQDLISVRSVHTSPTSIDRHVASQIAYPVYLRPQLRTLVDEVDVLDSFVACDHSEIVDGPTALYTNTLRPYIAIKLSTDLSKNETIKQITIPCKMEFTLAQDQTLYPTPEVESFNVTIPLQNMPLGSIDQSIKDKLAGIDQEIHSIERDISGWESTNEALQQIRDTSSLIAQTDAVMSGVATVVWAIAVVLYKIPLGATQNAAQSIWETSCGFYVGQAGSTGLHHLINLGVWYPGHIPGSILMPTPKTASIIQSCQLCNFGGTLQAVVPQTEGDIIVNYDGDSGQPTTLEMVTTFAWEPFKSIHVAQACLCPAGIEYNLRKERQVRCIYRNCVEEASKLGLPFSHCDKTLLEQNCLYVDGAAWKIAGGAATASAMRDLLANILGATPVMAAGQVWTSLCGPEIGLINQQAYSCQTKGGDPIGDWAVPLCGAWSGGLEITETDFFGDNKFGWNTFNGLLEGEDFCVN